MSLKLNKECVSRRMQCSTYQILLMVGEPYNKKRPWHLAKWILFNESSIGECGGESFIEICPRGIWGKGIEGRDHRNSFDEVRTVAGEGDENKGGFDDDGDDDNYEKRMAACS